MSATTTYNCDTCEKQMERIVIRMELSVSKPSQIIDWAQRRVGGRHFCSPECVISSVTEALAPKEVAA